MNKYLEKLAFYEDGEHILGTYSRRAAPKIYKRAGRWGAAGAVASGAVGFKKARDQKLSGRDTFKKTLGYALGGGALASGVSIQRSANKIFTRINSKFIPKLNNRKQARFAEGIRNIVHPPIARINKDLGFANPPLTKAEAKKHYKQLAMKHHPDRKGGSTQMMSKINKAWEDYQGHPLGFQKLAKLKKPG